MSVLPDGEDRMIISLFIWTKHRNVTDRQMDRNAIDITALALRAMRTRCKNCLNNEDTASSTVERTSDAIIPFIACVVNCPRCETASPTVCGRQSSDRLNCSVAAVRVISISNNIVISILISGVEESLNDVKMMRLASSILVLFAGNSLTQHAVYHYQFFLAVI